MGYYMDYQIITYTDKDFSLDVRVSLLDKNVWLTQNEIAMLFNKARSTISWHISNIFSTNELSASSCVENFDVSGGKTTKLYSLDVVISIGYRVKSNRGLLLKQFISNYFALSKRNETKNNDIIIYDDGTVHLSVEISPEEETVWLNVNEIAELFATSTENIYMHIKNIIIDNELVWFSTTKENLVVHRFSKKKLTQSRSGKMYEVDYYNLDMIFAIGYRVRSKNAFIFRNWATSVLKTYLLKGYSINETRCLECQTSIIQLQRDYQEIKNSINKQINFRPGEKELVYNAIVDFLKKAEKEIIIIDNYFGHDFDDVLSQINVEKTIVTNSKNSKIETNSIYKVVKRNDIHDRYIIVDDICYHFGTSIIDVGSNISSSSKIESKYFINHLKTFAKQ